ncbi:MAG: hypothetical protein ACYDA1_00635, partial [Vulcanimicrobiaceae bacterium]
MALTYIQMGPMGGMAVCETTAAIKTGLDAGTISAVESVKTICTVNTQSPMTSALNPIFGTIDKLLSFGNLGLSIGKFEVSIGETLFFVLLVFSLPKFATELRNANSLGDMIQSTFMRMVGIVLVFLLMEYAGAAAPHPFVDAHGQPVPLT